MFSKSQLLTFFLIFSFLNQSSSSENCLKYILNGSKFACGTGCTGTPSCGEIKCGNVDNMCYCDCGLGVGHCRTTDLGYKWNNGIKLANGSYALNGTKGDGKQYKC